MFNRQVSRRSLIKTLVGAAAAGLSPRGFSMVEDMKDRIAAIIREYDAQGIHRTGTTVDNASADWLANRIRALGITPELDAFAFERLEVHDARLVLDKLSITAVPLFDATYTSADGLTGTLGPLGSDADIGIEMILPVGGSDTLQRCMKARRENAHSAIVLVTDDRMPPGGVATLNAEDFTAPFGPPVIQVPNDHWPELGAASDAGKTVRLVAHASHVPARAQNVQAVIKGSDPDRAPLVIMTPRSGWWSCASERGGGLAAWLEMMRAIQAAGPVCDVVFTANTGHELGHTGLDHYLSSVPGLIRDAGMWIHLGANFAAAVGGGVRLQYVDETVRNWTGAYLDAAGIAPAVETPVGERPYGEARNVFDGGGRYISVLGSNGLFHHPADRWPDAVDLPLTTAWIEVLSRLAVDLSLGKGPQA